MLSRRGGILQPAPQLFSELFEVDRLREASYAACLQDPFLLCRERVSRHRDYRDAIQTCFSAHPSEETKAIFCAKIDVQQNYIGRLHPENFVAGFQVRSTPNFITLYLQPVLQQFPVGRIVFYN